MQLEPGHSLKLEPGHSLELEPGNSPELEPGHLLELEPGHLLELSNQDTQAGARTTRTLPVAAQDTPWSLNQDTI